ncbi:unnamed protein product [Heligmosomoides polygyrus]|uniref:Fibronectin type-III domain-containing protein n=1 Tax=Heligmosomoides polygyrus TaxID=6339 RepID=A0A183F6S5_HELPZ|nr:unnamed protein product [Heligmosomoides polygyrus]
MQVVVQPALSRDAQIITDPTITFTVSPPVRWTYYPVVAATGAISVTNFFPLQSMTSSDALQAAQNDIQAAYLEALSQQPLTTVGATTTTTYSPDAISNCYTGQPIPGGTRIGYLAGGAITQIALVTGQQTTATTCPLSTTMMIAEIGPYREYTKTITVSTRGGTTMTRYNWNLVISQFQSILNFRYQALFRSEIAISQN